MLFILRLNPRLQLLHLPGLPRPVSFRPLSLLFQLRLEIRIFFSLCFHALQHSFDRLFHLRIWMVDTAIHELGEVNLCQFRFLFFSGSYRLDEGRELLVGRPRRLPSLSILAFEQEDAVLRDFRHPEAVMLDPSLIPLKCVVHPKVVFRVAMSED